MKDSREGNMSHVDEGVLHAYLDAELPAAERAAVEAHVAQCADCHARLAEERALVARASEVLGFAAPRERPAPSFDQVGRRQRRSPWHVRMPVAWAASIALALGVGYYMHAPDTVVPNAAPRDIAAVQDRVVTPGESRAELPPPQRSPELGAARRNANRAAPRAAPLPIAPPSGERADVATTAQQRSDSPSSVLGEVAIRPEGYVLRSRQPAAAAAPAAVAPRLEEKVGGSEWPFASRDRARQILGTTPVGVPGLPVRAIRRDPGDNSGVVVEQELDAATVIQVYQRRVGQEQDTRALAREQSKAARPSNERLARFVGALRVEIAGPLQPDSLNRLLEQVQPLP